MKTVGDISTQSANYVSYNQDLVRKFRDTLEGPLSDFLSKNPMTMEESIMGVINLLLGFNCEIPTSQYSQICKGYLNLVMERRQKNEKENL